MFDPPEDAIGPSSFTNSPTRALRDGEPVDRKRVVSSAAATKSRLLDAAESLFADCGFESTTLRAVTRLAGVSVSAANYHFGSKEDLVLAAISRRLEPLNERRIDRLERSLAFAGGEPLSVRAVLEAFLGATFEYLHELANEGSDVSSYRQLAARLYTDPHDRIGALKAELFGSLADRYVEALEPSFPEVSREELLLRFHFVVGVLIHTISGHCQQGLLQADGSPVFDDADLFERMLAFASAGLCGADR